MDQESTLTTAPHALTTEAATQPGPVVDLAQPVPAGNEHAVPVTGNTAVDVPAATGIADESEEDVPDLFAPTDAFNAIAIDERIYILTPPVDWTARQFTHAAAIMARGMGSLATAFNIDGSVNFLGLIRSADDLVRLLREDNLVDDMLATVYVLSGARFDRHYPVGDHAAILSGAPGQAIGAAVRSFLPYLRKYMPGSRTSSGKTMMTDPTEPM